MSCGALAQGYVDIYEDTVINNNIDPMSIVRVHNAAQITVLDTSNVYFDLLDTSTVTIYGGRASYTAQDSSVLKIYGGNLDGGYGGSINYSGNLAQIYIYGQNFQMVPAGSYQYFFLQGNWLDGTQTDLYFRGVPRSFEQALGTNIFIIPEPATMLLLGFGMMLAGKKLRR